MALSQAIVRIPRGKHASTERAERAQRLATRRGDALRLDASARQHRTLRPSVQIEQPIQRAWIQQHIPPLHSRRELHERVRRALRARKRPSPKPVTHVSIKIPTQHRVHQPQRRRARPPIAPIAHPPRLHAPSRRFAPVREERFQKMFLRARSTSFVPLPRRPQFARRPRRELAHDRREHLQPHRLRVRFPLRRFHLRPHLAFARPQRRHLRRVVRVHRRALHQRRAARRHLIPHRPRRALRV